MLSIFRLTTYLILSWLLLTANVLAASKPAAGESAYQNLFLWQVTGGKLEKPSYLFGTIHVPDPRLFPLPAKVQEAMTSSQFIFTEIAIDSLTQLKVVEASQLPPGKTIESMGPKSLVDKYDAFLKAKKLGIMKPMLSRLQPWALATNIILLDKLLKYPSLSPMDKQIYDFAISTKNKQHLALESAEDQLKVFTNMKLEQQFFMLEATLDMLSDPKTDPVEELIRVYLSGQGEKMMATIEQYQMVSEEAEQKFMEALLDQRNVNMVNKMHTHFEKNPKASSFIAVGAAHYFGEKSINTLLKQKGYKVTKLTP